MKKLLIFLALVPALLAADAANDLLLSQVKPSGTGNIQRNVSPTAGSPLGFNTSLVPIVLTAFNQSSAGAASITASANQNITFTVSGSGIVSVAGPLSATGSVSAGAGGSAAGALVLTQGTTQSTGTTNITIQAPTSVTSYIRTLPGSVGSTGYVKETVSGSVQTESVVTSIPAADVSGLYAAHLGTFASPDTTAGSITWTAAVYNIYTSAAGGTRTYTLPAASSYSGQAFILNVAAGTNHVNIQPASGAQLVLAGTLLTADHYVQAATSAAGNYICFISDGTNWTSLGSSGTWADASSP